MASPTIRYPAIPSSISSRSGVRTGVRALDSQTYPPYIHHSAPNTSSTCAPSTTVTSCDKIPVSCVMAKTNTKSKNSSSVLTRSGSPPEPCAPPLLTAPVTAPPSLTAPVTVLRRYPGGTTRRASRSSPPVRRPRPAPPPHPRRSPPRSAPAPRPTPAPRQHREPCPREARMHARVSPHSPQEPQPPPEPQRQRGESPGSPG